MPVRIVWLTLTLIVWQASPGVLRAGVRIKDITELEGARGNYLTGLGLVVGLDGTGSKQATTQEVATAMLQRMDIGALTFKSGNISLVLVTTTLPPFGRKGSTMDVTVSALDDATSLLGGQLIRTNLKAVDNVVYAQAQGPVSTGAFSFAAPGGGGGAPATGSTQKNHPTVGRIANGATIECEARGKILCNGAIRFLLRDADPGTARAMVKVINAKFPDTAVAVDAGAVQVFVPRRFLLDLMSFVNDIGLLEVEPDVTARVVINERTGTIVAGNNVKIGTVAISHGNLAISTSFEPVASQPNPFGRGKTVVLPRGQVGVAEEGGQVRVLDKNITVGELARALNALGATPRDLIIIFQAMKKAGALHADLITM